MSNIFICQEKTKICTYADFYFKNMVVHCSHDVSKPLLLRGREGTVSLKCETSARQAGS